MYKNQFYFYTLAMKHSENKIKKTALFTTASKRMKYSNLTKEVQDLCTENYRTLQKEIKKTLNEMERQPMFIDQKACYC